MAGLFVLGGRRRGPHKSERWLPRSVPLCSVPMVLLQKPTKPFTTLNVTVRLPVFLPRFDEHVTQPLMISLPIGTEKVLANSTSQRSLAEEDDPVETLGFSRAEESLQMGVQIRALRR